MSKRKQIEADILVLAKESTKNGKNVEYYKRLFESLDDKGFQEFWSMCCLKGFVPMFFDNNDINDMIDYDNVIALAKRDNIPIEQSIIIKDPDSGLEIETPESTLVGYTKVRKLRQMVINKIGVAMNDINIDDLTGQPTGESKAGGISSPEVNVMSYLNIPTTAKELVAVKGGDRGAYRKYKNDILTTGKANINQALKEGTGAKSMDTVHFLLRGMGLDNNMGNNSL